MEGKREVKSREKSGQKQPYAELITRMAHRYSAFYRYDVYFRIKFIMSTNSRFEKLNSQSAKDMS